MTILFLFLLGLVFGSFLGALTYRLPRKVSINDGRSKCPNCSKIIAWYDNIPVISFLILRGRCRNCKKEISVRYSLIELATAVTFVLIGPNTVTLAIATILIAIFVIDLEHQLIFDELVFAGLGVLIANLLILDSPLIFHYLLAGFLAANFLLFLNLITRGRGMGLGDVKLALLIGTFLGLNKFMPWLLMSFISGSVVGLFLIVTKKATIKQKVPFGPFLIIGAILTTIFGNVIMKFFVF